MPATPTSIFIGPNKRSIILPGTAANKFYDFSVRAYRRVDSDIAASGVIYSTITNATTAHYRPATSVSFAGNVIGTIANVAASQVVTDLANLVSNNILSRAQKPTLLLAYNQLTASYNGAVGKANQLGGIATYVSAATAAYTALNTYLSGLTPAWNDLTQDSPVVQADFQSAFATEAAKQADLDAAIADRASQMATWVSITGTGKAADYATVGAKVGTNLLDSTGTQIATDAAIKNTAVTISPAGVLTGAGGGTVTLPGIGFTGDTDAQRNSRITVTAGALTGIGTGTGTVVDNTLITVSPAGALSGAGGGAITALDFTNVAGVTKPSNNATVGAQIGANLLDQGGFQIATDGAIKNTAVSISAAGALTGAGGGTVTLGGIAPNVDPYATRNRYYRGITDPGFTEDYATWNDTSGTMARYRVRRSGAWDVGATDGSQVGINLLDQSSTAIATDATIKNSAVTLSSSGALAGAGGGTITALDFTNIAGTTRPANNATVGARVGTNLLDLSGVQIATDGAIKNSAVSISSGGILSGAGGGTVTLPGIGFSGDTDAQRNSRITISAGAIAGIGIGAGTFVDNTQISVSPSGLLTGGGGGQVTIGGLGYTGDLAATRNRYSRSITDPGYAEDGAIWGDISGGMARLRVRRSAAWDVGATDGAQVGANLLDSTATSIATDSAIKNSAVTITAAGALSGAGGGSVTIGGLGYLGDLDAQRNSRITISAGAISGIGTGTGTVVDNSQITLSAAGAITGAGGGSITALDFANVAGGTKPSNNATVGARVGTNLLDLSGVQIATDAAIKNSAVTITSAGVLGGAGGGSVTIGGLGYTGDLAATRNRYARAAIDPGYTEDGAVWGDTSSGMARLRVRRSAAWDVGATDGAQVGANFLDSTATSIATDAAIKNSAVTISAAGALTGAGGGTVTLPGIGFSGDTDAQRNSRITISAGAIGGIGTGTGTIVDNTQITLSAAGAILGAGGGSISALDFTNVAGTTKPANNATVGARVGTNLLDFSGISIATDAAIKNSAVTLSTAGVLTGAGGGSITALPADNLIDGVTYGRYALVERSKLGGVAPGATVGAQVGINLLDFSAVQIATDAVIKNSAVSISAGGVLAGAGGGTVTPAGLETSSGVSIRNSTISISAAGALTGAGGGSVTIGGLGYTGDLAATRNRYARAAIDPGYTEDGAIWSDSSGVMSRIKVRRSAAWDVTATDGAQVGSNLLDSAATSIATDAVIKNSAVSISAAGILSGAGGGTVTLSGVGFTGDTDAQRNSRITITAGAIAGIGTGAGTVVDNTQITLSAAGVLAGAGGGSITALDFAGVAGATKPANNATVGARVGTNLLDLAGVSIATDAAIKNSAVTLSSAGVLAGAGGGSITALDFASVAGTTKPANNATVGAQVGTNLLDFAGASIATDAAIKNSAVTITAAGVLSGAGGGSVTIGGLGYTGDLAATRNRYTRAAIDPGYTEDGAIWSDSSGTMSRIKVRRSAAWDITATDGAQVGANLLDSSATAIATDAAIKNTAVSISAAGTLSGAGGGTVTLAGVGFTGDTDAQRNSRITIAAGAIAGIGTGTGTVVDNTQITLSAAGVLAGAGGGSITALDFAGVAGATKPANNATVGARVGTNLLDFGGVSIATDAAIKNSAVTITAAGVLSGAGGGAITALAADNLIDGVTYGRYALVERSKLGGVAAGATVGAQVGVNLLDFSAVQIATDAVIKNTAVSISAGGVLAGAGGGTVTPAGLETSSGVSIRNSTISISAAGALTGAGGGSVTIGGLGYLGDLSATRNRYARAAIDPGYTEDGAIWSDSSGAMSRIKVRRSAAWDITATDGAQVGANLLDSTAAAIATDAAIKNSAVTISAAGVLAGAGGGTVTLSGVGFTGDTDAQRNSRITIASGAISGIGTGTGTVVDNTLVTLSAAGAIAGAGGGSITALDFVNVAGGTKPANNATVGARVGTNLLDFSGVSIATDAAIKNSAVTISAAGILSGAGGGSITALAADNLIDGVTYGRYALTERTKLGTVATGADVTSANTAARIAGQGAWATSAVAYSTTAPVTPATGDIWVNTTSVPNVWQRYSGTAWVATTPTNTTQLTDGANLGGTAAWTGVSARPTNLSSLAGTEPILNTGITISSAGILSGAGGGAITALAADNLIDGVTYGRYALTERTKLGGVATGATVGAQVGVNLLDFSATQIATDAVIKNSAVTITAAGVLSGAGGGTVTLAGVGFTGDTDAQRNSRITLSAAGILGGAGGGAITALDFAGVAGVTKPQNNATVGAQVGTNLLDFSGVSIATDAAIKNAAVTITAAGVLSGAGGGTVTLGGIGYAGDVNATRNRYARQITDPGFTEDGAVWNDNSGAMPRLRVRRAAAWDVGATDGAAVGTNLLDQSATAIALDTAIKNTAVTISAAGVLAGAGGGAVTLLGVGFTGDTDAQRNSRITVVAGALGGIGTGTGTIVDNTLVTLSAAGAIAGAGGGSITALDFTNVAGTTKPQANATVGAKVGVNLLDSAGVSIATDAAIKNSAVTLSTAGVLTGAGGGSITALAADNLVDGVTYGRYAITERTKLGGVQTGATVGAQIGTNLLDFAGASIATDAAIKNAAVTITAAGVLTGAGGGTVTLSGVGFTGDTDAQRNSRITIASGALAGIGTGTGTIVDNTFITLSAAGVLGGAGGGTITALDFANVAGTTRPQANATVGARIGTNLLDFAGVSIATDAAIKNSAVTISSAGVLSGAGGGSITALAADNLIDGVTYGRYALTERTKLGTVATGADVTSANTAKNIAGQGAWATSAVAYSTTAPATPATGDIWVNTTSVPNVWQRYSGTAWVATTPTNTTQLTDGANLGGTAAWVGVTARPANLSSLAGSEPILNTGITISAAGALSGAGGGSITALPADNLIDGATYGRYALTERTKLGGVQTGATVGAQVGINLLDFSAVQIASDAAIKNTAVSISAGGVLAGAGGGTVTPVGLETASGVAIRNSTISISAAGALSGAGGGAITALAADNLVDGVTYGRYALVERTKLTGVQAGATVGAQVGTNLLDFSGVSIATDAVIKNSAVTITAGGVLSGAGGGSVTPVGLETASGVAIRNSTISISAAGVLAGAGGGSITALAADNLIDGVTYGRYALTERTKLGGVATGADVTSANTAKNIAGQGAWATSAVAYATVAPTTPATGDIWINTTSTPNVWQRYSGTAWVATTPTNTTQLADGANLGGTAAWIGVTARPANLSSLAGTEPILNTGITISAAGALSGAGGGSITALPADNLIDGATYGRYALTERTKLGGVQTGATVGAQIGTNLLDFGGVSIATDAAIKNTAVTITAAGVLAGAGGGSITALDFASVAGTTKPQANATVGARVGTNLLDFSGVSIATDAAIKNSAVSISSAGVLAGAGGGSITALPADNLIDGTTYGRYALTERTKLGGVQAGATVGAQVGTNLLDLAGVSIATDAAIKNSAVTISAAGVLTGAGGGSITALAADNLIDGVTYGRYALTERTKLGGVATGADVTSANTAKNILGQGAWATSAVSYATIAPTTPTTGDIWVNTTTVPNVWQRYSGTAWVATTPTNTTQLTDGANLGGTAVWTGVTTRPANLSSLVGTEPILNTGITISAAGVLSGAGGGSITALAADNLIDGATYGRYALTERTKLGGVQTGATVGAQVGINLLDFSAVQIATDAVIKNSAVSISAGGVLAGAGGGTVTPAGMETASGVAIRNSTITISAAGALSGAGGGAITALPADNLIDGATYGRYALTERTKLGGVATGADVTSANTAKNILGQGAWATSAVTYATAAPVSPVAGDIWINTTSTPNVWQRYNGTAWVATTPTNTTQLTDGANLGGTAAWAGVTTRPANLSSLAGTEPILNTGITISAGGILAGAGGGTVTPAGLETASGVAIRNSTITISTAGVLGGAGGGAITALAADNLVDGVTYGRYALVERTKLGGVAAGATVGAQVGVNFLDFSAVQIATDAVIKNSAVSISAGGVLGGAGGGTVTPAGLETASGVAIRNSTITISTAGVLTGAGGGAITALPADNLIDGATYGRYALVERTKLGGVAAGATVGAQVGTNLLDSTAVQIATDAAIKNTAVTISAGGVLAGAGGGTVTPVGLETSSGVSIRNSTITISASGALSGAGGGAITALSSDNLADGATYGRYALTERTKLATVAPSADVTSANTAARVAGQGPWATSAVAYAATAPATPATGDIWVNTTNTPNVWQRYNGTIWVATTPTNTTQLTDGANLGGTAIWTGVSSRPANLSSLAGSEPILNTGITISAAGALSGAGGGAITALPADNLIDGATYGRYALTERTKLGTVAPNADVTSANTAKNIAGQGAWATSTVTYATTAPATPLAGDIWINTTAVPNVWQRYTGTVWVATTPTNTTQLADGANLGGTAAWAGVSARPANVAALVGTEAIQNTGITISAAGVLAGAGGGAITALAADNLIDGVTYGRYALVERTKLGTVATGADVTSANTAKNIAGQGAWATAAVTYATAAPTTPATGDIWVNTTAVPNVWQRYSGSAWVATTPTNTTQLTDGANLGGTAVWTGVTTRPANLSSLVGSEPILNTGITISSAGVLSGAGGGSITALAADNLIDGVTYGRYALVERTKLGGVAAGATVGAQVGTNLLDSTAVQIATDAAIKNSAVTISAGGLLGGAGGGTVTPAGLETASGVAIRNSTITISAAGALTGAGGGSITALPADNLIDGATYGRYALVERTKLGTVATGADVTSANTAKNIAGQGAWATSAVTYATTAPVTPATGDIWINTTAVPNVWQRYTGTVWVATTPTNTTQLTDGANLGGTAVWTSVSSRPTNLSSLAGTEPILNTGITISSAGVLSGAGGGSITALAADNLIDGVTYGRYALTERTKLGGVATGATVGAVVGTNLLDQSSVLIATDAAIKNSAVSLSAAGVLAGAGGGTITALDFANVAGGTKPQANATVGARVGTNLLDFSGVSIATDAAIKNSAVTISAAGVLGGAGGGSITALAADNLIDGVTYGRYALTERTKLTGVATGATVGAQVSINLLDSTAVQIATDAAIKNSAVSISAGGVLAGAGGGTVTPVGLETASGVAIRNTSITISAAGALSGAGGGAITALPADNLIDGTTYGRYALTERTKLGGVATGADVTSANTAKNILGQGAWATAAVTYATVAPTTPATGDIWVNTTAVPNVWQRYSGAAWVATTPTNTTQLADGANLGGTASWTGVSARPANLSALAGSEAIQNTGITISSAGVLAGAGGGSITALSSDNLADGVTYGRYQLTERTKLATVAPNADVTSANTAKNIAGQGAWATSTVTYATTAPTTPLAGDIWINTTSTPNVWQRYSGTVWVATTPTNTTQLTDGANLGGTAAWAGVSARPANLSSLAGTEAIQNTGITITAAGVLSGAGGGSITALAADNLIDGATYGRYALTERTKLGTVATGADVTSANTAARITGQGAWATSAVTYATTAPATPATGDIWVNSTSVPNVWQRYNGTAWVATTPTNTTQLTDGANLGGTAAWTGVTTRPANLSSLAGSEPILNTGITISAGGILAGAGGGTVTPAGLETASGVAIRNSTITISSAGALSGAGGGAITALPADNLIDGATYGRYALTERTKLGGVATGADVTSANTAKNILGQGAWATSGVTYATTAPTTPATGDIWINTTSVPNVWQRYSGTAWVATTPTNTTQLTDGANLGGTAAWTGVTTRPANLSSLAGTEAILNTGITISAGGVLAGAGGGTVTPAGMETASGVAIRNSTITISAAGALSGAGGGGVTISGLGYSGDLNATYGARVGSTLYDISNVVIATDAVIKNSAVTISAAGVLSGAGGGSITALAADNLIDGATYGRYALTERSKLGGVATGATVGAISGTNLYDSGAVLLTDKLIRNSYVENGIGYISRPTGGSLGGQAANATGMIKIVLPHLVTDGNSTMIRFEVDIYEYNTTASVKYLVGGYTYNATPSWINVFANVIGGSATTRPVYFGNDGTNWCVWIGDVGTVWQYPAVTVRNVQTSYGANLTSAWETGWAVTISTVARSVTNVSVPQPVAGDSIVGTNLLDQSKTIIATDAVIKNSAVSISAAGVLAGAGGGTVTAPGLGVSAGAGTALSLTGLQLNASVIPTIIGNSVTGIFNATGGWEQGAISKERTRGGASASCIVTVNSPVMFGLTTKSTPTATYTQIDYALYFSVGNNYTFYSNGGNYAANLAAVACTVGDQITVTHDNVKVRFFVNGIAVHITNVLTSNEQLRFMVSINDAAAAGGVSDCRFAATVSNDFADAGGTTKPQNNATVGADLTNLNVTIGGYNLVKNSSFEGATYTSGNGPMAAGVALYCNSETATTTTSIVAGRTGGNGLQVAWTANTSTKGFYFCSSAGNVDNSLMFQPNTTMMLSYYAKATGLAVGQPMQTAWNNGPSGGIVAVSNPALTANWQRYVFRLIWGAVVDGNGYVSIAGGTANGTATLVFDDVQVEVGDTVTAYGANGVARVASNLYDISNTVIATDAVIKNSAVTMSAAGVLAGAGGGSITALSSDNLADGGTYGRYALAERTKLTTVEQGATAGDNLIANGGAENGLAAWQIDAGYTGGTFTASTVQKKSGTQSFLLNKTAVANQVAASSNAIAVNPGDTYTFTFWTYAGAAFANGLYFSLYTKALYPAAGYIGRTTFDNYNDFLGNGAGAAGVTQYTFTYTIPAGMYWASVAVLNYITCDLNLYFEVSMQKQIAWQANIGGVGKPANYADVTASQPIVSQHSATSGNALTTLTDTNGRRMNKFGGTGNARDADVVSFATTLPSVPTMVFLPGGNAASAGSNVAVQATGVSVSGFTMKARSQAVTAGATVNDGSTGTRVAGDPDIILIRSNSSAPFDGNFRFTFSVTVGLIGGVDPGSIDVQIYVRKSGSWVNVGSGSFGSTGSYSITVAPGTVDYAAGVAEFGMSKSASTGTGSALSGFGPVSYTLGSVVETILTPTGASAIPWLAILQ